MAATANRGQQSVVACKIDGVCDIFAGICGLLGGIPLLVLALVGGGVLGSLPNPDVRPLAFLPVALFLPLAMVGTLVVLIYFYMTFFLQNLDKIHLMLSTMPKAYLEGLSGYSDIQKVAILPIKIIEVICRIIISFSTFFLQLPLFFKTFALFFLSIC